MIRKGSMWMAIFGMILIGLYQWFYGMTRTPISEQEKQTVVSIPAGANVGSIARQLHEEKLLDYPLVFNALARMMKQENKFRAGDYRVDTSWTYEELLMHLIKDPEIQYPITIIEGMTTRDAMSLVQSHHKIQRTLADRDQQALQAALKIEQLPEGVLLPDTYFIRANTKETELYQRAYQALMDLFAREWSKRVSGLPFENPYQALVAASIVEKETGKADERPLIASVIVNRLKKGMPLQMDPTVIYGLGDRFDGNIRKKDLSDPSPYNTYVHKGLPPTPIALSSAESIYEVLHPANTDYLFFVAKGDGSHHFTTTFDAHNQAVKQYQLGAK